MNKDEKRNVIKSGIFNKSGDKKKLVNYRNLIRFKIDFITDGVCQCNNEDIYSIQSIT